MKKKKEQLLAKKAKDDIIKQKKLLDLDSISRFKFLDHQNLKKMESLNKSLNSYSSSSSISQRSKIIIKYKPELVEINENLNGEIDQISILETEITKDKQEEPKPS